MRILVFQQQPYRFANNLGYHRQSLYRLCFFVLSVCFFIFFFFSSRRRHTRSKRDWSSDVCSSDLIINPFRRPRRPLEWIDDARWVGAAAPSRHRERSRRLARNVAGAAGGLGYRSEERRVGKEGRTGWGAEQ